MPEPSCTDYETFFEFYSLGEYIVISRLGLSYNIIALRLWPVSMSKVGQTQPP